jgi:hypothetical protein
MPVRYVIDVNRRLVRTSFTGILTVDDLLTHIAELRADPAFNPQFSEIIDASQVEDVPLGYEELKRLAPMDPFSTSTKRAFVIPTRTVAFGVARMYQLLQNEDPRIRIFQNEEDAARWLLKAS